MKKFLKLLFATAGVIILFIAAGLAAILVRFPTMHKLRHELGWTLVEHREIAQKLCHNDEAGGIVGPTFLKDYKPNVPTSAPSPILDIIAPKSAEKEGHGTARVSGIAISGSYINGDHALLPGSSPCQGTIAFDYRFLWDDNGVSRQWECQILNVTVAGD